MRYTKNYELAAVVAQAENRIGFVRIDGVLHPSAQGALLADNAAFMSESACGAQVVRYDGALLLLSPHEMLENARRVLAVARALLQPVEPEAVPPFHP